MTIGSPEGPPPPWNEVHQEILSLLEALASSTAWIPTAASAGIEPIFDRVLQQVCEPRGLEPTDYIQLISGDLGLRAQVQSRLVRLMEHPALLGMRREAQRREAEHQLHVLRYVLSGQKPPQWVWESLDEEQQAELREAVESGEEQDAVLLQRVERTLEKLASGGVYGECEDCATPILLERLQIVPWAECCAACQNQREGTPAEDPGPRVQVVYF